MEGRGDGREIRGRLPRRPDVLARWPEATHLREGGIGKRIAGRNGYTSAAREGDDRRGRRLGPRHPADTLRVAASRVASIRRAAAMRRRVDARRGVSPSLKSGCDHPSIPVGEEPGIPEWPARPQPSATTARFSNPHSISRRRTRRRIRLNRYEPDPGTPLAEGRTGLPLGPDSAGSRPRPGPPALPAPGLACTRTLQVGIIDLGITAMQQGIVVGGKRTKCVDPDPGILIVDARDEQAGKLLQARAWLAWHTFRIKALAAADLVSASRRSRQ